MQSSSASSATGLPRASNSMAWALNSGVYCFLGLLGVMSGFWCLLVQNFSAPQLTIRNMGLTSCNFSEHFVDQYFTCKRGY
jgi:hypothetical protein